MADDDDLDRLFRSTLRRDSSEWMAPPPSSRRAATGLATPFRGTETREVPGAARGAGPRWQVSGVRVLGVAAIVAAIVGVAIAAVAVHLSSGGAAKAPGRSPTTAATPTTAPTPSPSATPGPLTVQLGPAFSTECAPPGTAFPYCFTTSIASFEDQDGDTNPADFTVALTIHGATLLTGNSGEVITTTNPAGVFYVYTGEWQVPATGTYSYSATVTDVDGSSVSWTGMIDCKVTPHPEPPTGPPS